MAKSFNETAKGSGGKKWTRPTGVQPAGGYNEQGYPVSSASGGQSAGGSSTHETGGHSFGGSSGSFGGGSAGTAAETAGQKKAVGGTLKKSLGGTARGASPEPETAQDTAARAADAAVSPAAPASAAGGAPVYDTALPQLPEGSDTAAAYAALPDFSFGESPAPRFDYEGRSVQFDNPGPDPALQQQYRDAMAALEQMKGQAPSYGSQYDEQLRELYQQITGRAPFRYDSASDPLYRQYVQDYTQQGRTAMRDTMGQAASFTGGYGSSYAQSVGRQQYDAYLQRLADVLPQTYGMALDAYKAEGERAEKALALTQELEASDYARFLDKLKQYNTDVDRAQNAAEGAYERLSEADERAYRRAADEYARKNAAEREAYERSLDAYERERDAANTAYSRQQDAYARQIRENELAYERAAAADKVSYERAKDQRARQEAYYNRLLGLMSMGYAPTRADFAAAGLSEAQGEALRASFAPTEAPAEAQAQSVSLPADRTDSGSAADARGDDGLNKDLRGAKKKRGAKKA
ncbi:MAG: hypothetical protein IJP64_06310 [Oscillospiraceae bacterium]|nr:hypothetical protein [Oscillospiraceae bacterium]